MASNLYFAGTIFLTIRLKREKECFQKYSWLIGVEHTHCCQPKNVSKEFPGAATGYVVVFKNNF